MNTTYSSGRQKKLVGEEKRKLHKRPNFRWTYHTAKKQKAVSTGGEEHLPSFQEKKKGLVDLARIARREPRWLQGVRSANDGLLKDGSISRKIALRNPSQKKRRDLSCHREMRKQ